MTALSSNHFNVSARLPFLPATNMDLLNFIATITREQAMRIILNPSIRLHLIVMVMLLSMASLKSTIWKILDIIDSRH